MKMDKMCLPFIVVYFTIIITSTIQVKGDDLASNVSTINEDDNTTRVENVTTIIGSGSNNNENEPENTTETKLPEVTNVESNATSRAIDITTASIPEDRNSTLEITNLLDTNVTDYESINNEEEDGANSTKYSSSGALNDVKCLNVNNSNDYIDNMIDEISKYSSGEAKLPSKYGYFILTDGKIWGLSDMQRVGDVEILCTNSSRTLDGLLRFHDLKAKYTWRRTNLLSTWKGYVILLVDKIDVKFEIKQNNSGAYLDYFKIKDVSGIRTEVTGLTYLTWTLSRFTNLVINNFRRTVGVIIEGPLKQAFSVEVRRYNFPRV